MLVVTLALGAAFCRHDEPLPVLYPAPDAEFINQNGAAVSLASFRGSVVVYDFIFTNCAASCPLMTRRMHDVVEGTDKSLPVQFVSVSVDPSRDTPEVLAAYARRSGADERWTFLTGGADTIRRVTVKGFKLPVEPVQPGSEALLHSTKFVLADRHGQIRGYYDSLFPDEMKKLEHDIASLAENN